MKSVLALFETYEDCEAAVAGLIEEGYPEDDTRVSTERKGG